MDDDQFVGYGNPPRGTRFQKGKSGNPKGRPKKSEVTEARALEEACKKRVWVNESGKRRRLSMLEVIAKQLVAKAGGGDPKFMKMLYERLEHLSKHKEIDLNNLFTEHPRINIVFHDPVKREE